MPQYYKNMKNLFISIKITLAFCVVLFVGYVLVLWGVAALTKPNSGQAELVTLNGKVVGAANVGQQFTDAKYFWSRPSAVDYDGSGSGGSNKGVTNPEYLEEVEARIEAFLVAHPYLNRADVPSEIVTASASGLDPHISPAAARVQTRRVAEARGVAVEDIDKLVSDSQERALVGTSFVNVLKLNVALDEKYNR